MTVFLPDHPATLGHVLLVPDQHVPDIWALDQGTARTLASETLRVAAAVRAAKQPLGLNIVQSNGEVASQSIKHLHVHVLPRWPGDAVRDLWPEPDPEWSESELDATQRDLRTAMGSIGASGYDLTNEHDREDRRKHLDLISAVITRMAGSSAAAKGWSVTLAGAAFGVALVRESWPFIALGILVLVAFAALDARYLNAERRARQIYDAVADDNSVVPLSLRGLATSSGRANRFWPSNFRNWSIWLFYGPLAVVGGLLLILALFAGPEQEPSGQDDPRENQSQGG